MRAVIPGVVAAVLTGAAATEAHPFVINEVVSDPQHDWNDAASPFDAAPGAGAASSADEYVELKNVSVSSASLEGFSLQLQDGSDVIDCFGFALAAPCTAAAVYRVFASTGVELTGGAVADRLRAVPAGGYVVIGNPSGSINNAITLTLRDPLLAPIDVAIVDANATSPVDESASRLSDGADSDGPGDFVPLAASLGRSNGALCTLAAGDAVINEVVADPQRDWNHDGAPTAFDGTPGAGMVSDADEYVEIKNVSGGSLDLARCVLSLGDTTPSALVLQASDPRLFVFDALGVPLGGLVAVPWGGYLVIGDPPGAINNAVVVTLHGTGVIDALDFGGDAPALGAASAEAEAGSRLPDGGDSGVGAMDVRLQRGTPGSTNALDECALGLASCPEGSSCSDTDAGYACSCAPGYTHDGHGCVDVDECQLGSHDCHALALCSNSAGGFTCSCPSGYDGDGRRCTDVDECALALAGCDAHARCDNRAGGFDCTCDAGWEGDGSECRDVDECASGGHDCASAAACVNTPGAYRCDCAGADDDACEPAAVAGPQPGVAGCSVASWRGHAAAWLFVLSSLALSRRRGSRTGR